MTRKYIQFLASLKKNILQSRYTAASVANREQLTLYLKIGRMLSEKIAAEKWGAKILQQIAIDLQKQMPGLRGFSYTSLKNMRQFATAYSNFIDTKEIVPFGQSLTGQLQLPTEPQFPPQNYNYEHFMSISFSHHMVILNKCPQQEERIFYMLQAANQFWSISLLEHQIDADLFSTQGRLPNNFQKALPRELKDSALQVFQDEYLMDFISSSDTDDERAFENKVVADIRNFILQMGNGFSFIANQYRVELDGEEFFIDLLFFNRHLQCLVAFELKRGKFKPEYAGKLNFYLNVLDEKVKLQHEQPSIGIILCKEKSNTVVEFAIKSIDKAMGVSTYRMSKQLPKAMRGILPDASELKKLM